MNLLTTKRRKAARRYSKGVRLRRINQNAVDDISISQNRMEAYLKATQASFEASLQLESKLGLDATGVLAGPRVRIKN